MLATNDLLTPFEPEKNRAEMLILEIFQNKISNFYWQDGYQMVLFELLKIINIENNPNHDVIVTSSLPINIFGMVKQYFFVLKNISLFYY